MSKRNDGYDVMDIILPYGEDGFRLRTRNEKEFRLVVGPQKLPGWWDVALIEVKDDD